MTSEEAVKLWEYLKGHKTVKLNNNQDFSKLIKLSSALSRIINNSSDCHLMINGIAAALYDEIDHDNVEESLHNWIKVNNILVD